MKSLLYVVAGVLISATADANEFLKPEEVRKLMVGKKILVQGMPGPLFDFQMNEDSTTSTSAFGGDVGKWRLSEEGYCTTWVNESTRIY